MTITCQVCGWSGRTKDAHRLHLKRNQHKDALAAAAAAAAVAAAEAAVAAEPLDHRHSSHHSPPPPTPRQIGARPRRAAPLPIIGILRLGERLGLARPPSARQIAALPPPLVPLIASPPRLAPPPAQLQEGSSPRAPQQRQNEPAEMEPVEQPRAALSPINPNNEFGMVLRVEIGNQVGFARQAQQLADVERERIREQLEVVQMDIAICRDLLQEGLDEEAVLQQRLAELDQFDAEAEERIRVGGELAFVRQSTPPPNREREKIDFSASHDSLVPNVSSILNFEEDSSDDDYDSDNQFDESSQESSSDFDDVQVLADGRVIMRRRDH